MKFRIAAAVVLLVVGIALPISAVAKRGPPWGFRGHQAVLLESSGKIEVMRGEDKPLDVKPGIFLDAGDIVRVPRYGEARLRMPSADVVIGDGTMLTVTRRNFTLGKGVVEVLLPKGTTPFDVEADGIEGRLTLRPGAEGGIVRVVADGQSEIRAYVKNGSCEATVPGADGAKQENSAETGKVIVIGSDKKVKVEGAPSSLTIAPVCDGKRMSVDVPPGTQVFAASNLYFPRDGKVSAEVSSGSVSVFARDVAGNFARVVAPCRPPK